MVVFLCFDSACSPYAPVFFRCMVGAFMCFLRFSLGSHPIHTVPFGRPRGRPGGGPALTVSGGGEGGGGPSPRCTAASRRVHSKRGPAENGGDDPSGRRHGQGRPVIWRRAPRRACCRRRRQSGRHDRCPRCCRLLCVCRRPTIAEPLTVGESRLGRGRGWAWEGGGCRCAAAAAVEGHVAADVSRPSTDGGSSSNGAAAPAPAVAASPLPAAAHAGGGTAGVPE